LNEAECIASLATLHINDLFFDHVVLYNQFRSGNYGIVDSIGLDISSSNPIITGYEVKISRGDFLQDTKWPKYLPFCHCLYFACPAGLLKPTEIDDKAGLIYCYSDKKARTIKKAPYRNTIIPANLFIYLLYHRLNKEPIEVTGLKKSTRAIMSKRSANEDELIRKYVDDIIKKKLYNQDIAIRELKWIEDIMKEAGIKSLSDLNMLINKSPVEKRCLERIKKDLEYSVSMLDKLLEKENKNG